jgi:phosphoribosylformylglycinamidine cyclo-ligase
VSEDEMFRTFNMGVGMLIVVDSSDANAVLEAGIGAFVMGEVVEGNGVALV